MNLQGITSPYKTGLNELASMVLATEREVIHGEITTSLVTDNINFFTKSFLISACAHLEMCIKEIVFNIASDIDARLSSISVPSSIIEWRYAAKKRNEQMGGRVLIGMSRKEVDEMVSGNVYKTKEALALVGVDISKNKSTWESWKDLIQAIVTRRNNIVHHNDDASDISFSDVNSYIMSMISYIDYVIGECNTQIQ